MQLKEQELLQLAETFGTPLYVYHQEKIEAQYQKLTTAFSGTTTRFFYACKALSNLNILKIIRQMGCGLDTVSINEVRLGLLAGFAPHQILYTPNCVNFEEITQAVDLGVHVNIDNISILEQFGNFYGNTYPIMIRFNPHIMGGGNYNISTGHIDSKFGISIHQLRHVLRIVKATNIQVEGLHMHTGSEIKDIQVFTEGMEVMLSLLTHFEGVKILDLGSGFKVKYKEGEKETDVHLLGQNLMSKIQDYKNETGRDIEVWFEPGKYLVSECGYFIVQANVVKPTPATVFVGVNAGFNQLIRPMFYQSHHEIRNVSNSEGTERIYTVVGNLCETDTFCWDRVLPEVREGDYLTFLNAGAYGFEMSMQFNSRVRPAEILYAQQQGQIIRKREVFDDLQRNVVQVID